MLKIFQYLARDGWSNNPKIQSAQDRLLAPTIYWLIQQRSKRIRASNPKDNTEFDTFWLNILLPNKNYNDIYSGWANNNRFRAVARLEYLRSRYRNTTQYNQAESIMLKSLKNKDEDLPSRNEIIELFQLDQWDWKASSRTGEDDYKFHLMKEKLGLFNNSKNGSVNTIDASNVNNLEPEDIALNSPILNWELEDVLEIGGCCVHGRNEFNLFAEENQLYEVFTLDYVEKLGLLIRKLRSKSNKKHFQICELGAGSGALTHHLRRYFEIDGDDGIDIIATDSGTWNLDTRFAVEPYSNSQALERLKPDVVLVSWMPAETDWTASFRRNGISHYILVGESDDGCTGHNWETWGNPTYRDEDTSLPSSNKTFNSTQTLYAKDGYKRKNLDELSNIQLQRYDCSHSPRQSTTVLISRN